jgi:hypothetical protein
MFAANEYVMNKVYEQRRDEIRREAEDIEMLRQAGLLRPGFFSRTARHAAGIFGQMLISLGRRLQHLESASPAVHARHFGMGG